MAARRWQTRRESEAVRSDGWCDGRRTAAAARGRPPKGSLCDESCTSSGWAGTSMWRKRTAEAGGVRLRSLAWSPSLVWRSDCGAERSPKPLARLPCPAKAGTSVVPFEDGSAECRLGHKLDRLGGDILLQFRDGVARGAAGQAFVGSTQRGTRCNHSCRHPLDRTASPASHGVAHCRHAPARAWSFLASVPSLTGSYEADIVVRYSTDRSQLRIGDSQARRVLFTRLS